jgi:hypothetical protein
MRVKRLSSLVAVVALLSGLTTSAFTSKGTLEGMRRIRPEVKDSNCFWVDGCLSIVSHLPEAKQIALERLSFDHS